MRLQLSDALQILLADRAEETFPGLADLGHQRNIEWAELIHSARARLASCEPGCKLACFLSLSI